jgi:GNAT superfamily N-acetyltransferase
MPNTGIPLNWRAVTAGERSEYSRLLDRAFGLSVPMGYLQDFPVWDPEVSPAPNRYQIGGFQGPRLVCTASVRVAHYRFADGVETKLGLIGAVATHPDFANKGHASEAIALVIHEGERRGVNGFALWGSESPLYKKRNFEFAGRQLRVGLGALKLPKAPLEGFEFRAGWDFAIAEHLLKRKSGLRYIDSDVLWLSRHLNVEWRTLWLGGKCIAYAAWNRGIDLPGIIHELDGEPTACLTLLRMLQDRYDKLEWIAHPDLFVRWKIAGSETGVTEALAQFRRRTLDDSRVDTIWFSGMDSC